MNNRRLSILMLVLSGILVLSGCALVIGGWYFYQNPPLSLNSFVTAPQSSQLPVSPGAPQAGSAAPDFTLKGLDKQPVQLATLRGKVVMLNFWATWCGPCSAEMPNIEAVYQKLNKDDVAILAVNQGEYGDQVSGYADLYRLHIPIVLDEKTEVAHLYHVQALPTTIFINRDGTIRDVHIGGPMSVEFIQKQINDMLGQSK
jgi:peroxiredoxin